MFLEPSRAHLDLFLGEEDVLGMFGDILGLPTRMRRLPARLFHHPHLAHAARAGDADLLLWLSEGGAEPVPLSGAGDGGILRVATKADVIAPASGAIPISAQTGVGVEMLCDEIAGEARKALGDGESALVIRQRHRQAIQAARDFLEAALAEGKPLEIVAEDLRLAGRSLAGIVGAIDVEQVLDAVFSRFCIGK